ncbi:hypothetical protein RB195_019533 [Necator americanus]|uniref:Uncharacterized protein n=1 Tax=Necator americanus TaxID=51031 RepID=A0ABR1CEL9_NECAM
MASISLNRPPSQLLLVGKKTFIRVDAPFNRLRTVLQDRRDIRAVLRRVVKLHLYLPRAFDRFLFSCSPKS